MKLPDRMKGIMFAEQGKAVIEEEPTPTLSAGQVMCKTIFTGLTNGTERNFLCGGNYGGYSWPTRIGYQNVGEIIAVADDVEGFAPGEIIFSGDLCDHVEYFAAPAGPEALIVKIPEGVEPEQAALFGLASVAMHDVQRAEILLGERALVIGGGLIGQFTAQSARLAGAQVTVVDLDTARLETAAGLGAHRTVQVAKDGGWDEVAEGGRFDVVFEDSGAPVLDIVIGTGWGDGLTKPRARIVMIVGRERVDYAFNAAQARELTILHAGHFTAADLTLVARLTAEGALRVKPLIKEKVKIDDAVAIYDRLRDNPASLMGTVFDWQ